MYYLRYWHSWEVIYVTKTTYYTKETNGTWYDQCWTISAMLAQTAKDSFIVPYSKKYIKLHNIQLRRDLNEQDQTNPPGTISNKRSN